ncbi:MAG TPA: hypothetical protein VFK43_04445, partial [Acidimicrobiales bacterium]|nr:hypothetical protein [Acidimicrobiales bacterium]
MPELPDLPGDDDPQARSGSWIPVAAIAVVAAVHTVLLHGRNYVQNDDIFQFTAAQKWGLSWDLLRLNVFNHFGPINRASHWAVLQLSPLNPDAALAASVAYLVAALASLNWLMAVLGASARRRAAIVVLLGSSLPLFMTTTWLDSAVHTYGAL